MAMLTHSHFYLSLVTRADFPLTQLDVHGLRGKVPVFPPCTASRKKKARFCSLSLVLIVPHCDQ